MAYIDGNEILFSAQVNGLVSVDTEMSDESENPVQNKVLKSYVDNNTQNIATEAVQGITINELTPDMAGQQMINIPSAPAVVNYVSGYAELKKEWEVIPVAVNELSVDAAQWETQVELYGNTEKGVRVMLLLPPNTTLPNNRATMTVSLNKSGGVNRIMTVRAEGWKISEAQTVCVFDIVPRAGVWNVETTPYQKTVDTVQGSMLYGSGDKVRYVTFKANDTNKLPAGTSINVWGLK